MRKKDFLYKNIYDTLKNRITQHIYKPNSKLPTEDIFRDEFNVSTITVKKALGILADEGFIERIPGKGTFVKSDKKASLGAIGLVLEHVSSPFGLTMMYALDTLAAEKGYKLFIRFSYGSREKETKEIEFLLSLGVKGLIVMPSHGEHYNPMILTLVLDDFPIVLVDKKLKGIDVVSVRTDNIKAVGDIVQYLYDKDCRKIGFICTDERGATSVEERRKGFTKKIKTLGLAECKECHIKIRPYYSDTNELNQEAIETISQYLKNEAKNLDSVVMAEYGIAREFVYACKRLKIVPNKDLLACCIDEDYLAVNGYTFPHMKQDENAIAQKAINSLESIIQGKELDCEDYQIPAIFNDLPAL